jgi:hypothetical protein
MRPLIPVRIIGPGGAVQLDQVLVDNGSVDTIFPMGIASWVGANLIARPPGVQWSIRWRGDRYPLEFAQIEIELTDHHGAVLRWTATVGFSTLPIPSDGLLGNFGCLIYMNATFRGEDNGLSLESNGLYPGVAIVSP